MKGNYKKVAELIANDKNFNKEHLWACNALNRIGFRNNKLKAIFDPHDTSEGIFFVTRIKGEYYDLYKEDNEHRVISLLLMHEMERTGDLK